MNEIFMSAFNQEYVYFQDCTQVIHSFSLMNLVAQDKFIQFCFQLFEKKDALERMTILDISQLLSTAKHQDISSTKSELAK